MILTGLIIAWFRQKTKGQASTSISCLKLNHHSSDASIFHLKQDQPGCSQRSQIQKHSYIKNSIYIYSNHAAAGLFLSISASIKLQYIWSLDTILPSIYKAAGRDWVEVNSVYLPRLRLALHLEHFLIDEITVISMKGEGGGVWRENRIYFHHLVSIIIITTWGFSRLLVFSTLQAAWALRRWDGSCGAALVKSKKPACCAAVLLPDGLLALALVHVSVFGLLLSSGLDPAALAGALLPMQLKDTGTYSRRRGCVCVVVQREVDTHENVQVYNTATVPS